MDFCKSPKNGVNEITGELKVGVVYFTRNLYCHGNWFEPKPVDTSEKLQHNSFFQRVKETWKAWKQSKSR